MKPLSALLIINAQNVFLSPGEAFTKQHIEPQQLCDAIGWLVQAARQQHRSIVWITSQSGDTANTPTQPISPGCGQDSGDSKLAPALPDLFTTKTDAEIHIVKQGYDAFVRAASPCGNGTNLYHWLQQQQITKLSLCGVTTDICIAHTAKTALQLGYEVEILGGATSASTQSKHLLAIRELERLGASTRNWVELLSEGNPVRLTQIAGTSMLDCAALSTCIDADTFETLYREVAWNQMSHRGSFVPRLVALQGTKEPDGVEPLYRHPADEQPPLLHWTPTIAKIRQEVERRIGHPLNHCLIQLYRNGRDWIGKHADKTLDVMRPSFIVNVSIGTTRTMVFRPKNTQQLPLQKLPLPHGSLFMLSLESNQAFYHEIERLGAMGTDEPRISLTLRYIGTFYDPHTGAVWGIGAPSKTRAEAIDRLEWRDTLSPTARLAQEKAEAERMVGLFREENIDENFDATAYQPGFDILDFRGLL
jgi:nicotinamidase-related amidase/alkylated DNA repair dioxygenase AlkB